jgi:hypothetical protein
MAIEVHGVPQAWYGLFHSGMYSFFPW